MTALSPDKSNQAPPEYAGCADRVMAAHAYPMRTQRNPIRVVYLADVAVTALMDPLAIAVAQSGAGLGMAPRGDDGADRMVAAAALAHTVTPSGN